MPQLTLTYRGERLDVAHIMPTLRTEEKCRRWKDVLDAHAVQANAMVISERIKRVASIEPDIYDIITDSGTFQPKLVNKWIERYKQDHRDTYDTKRAEWESKFSEPFDEYVPLDDRAAFAMAMARVQDEWADWLKNNEDFAKILYWELDPFPTNLSSLRLGIKCIKDTVDRTYTKPDVLELIDTPHEGEGVSDFWMDVQAVEVALYVDSFRHACK